MSLAIVYSRAQEGINAPLITIEVHLSNGLPGLAIVGLPETTVKESKDRVRSALLNTQFKFPAKRITINLAPADIPKEGSRFDLPIAIGILAASDQIPNNNLAAYECVGELALDGKVRSIQGALPIAIQARNADRILIAPSVNAREAALVQGVKLLAVDHLLDACSHFQQPQTISIAKITEPEPIICQEQPDIADVCGQHQVKRALEIMAAGGHNLIMLGPPGTGKSMLANRLAGILPPMSEDEALETAAIHSISNYPFNPEQWLQRPFRAPHHTASGVALVGGGSNPKPGEISLAHNGVLFLDELPEFDRRVLEVLREPLESQHITISRATRQINYPANFQLVAAMNPCPCGYLGDESGRCSCTADQVSRYRRKISGPLLDRIDIHAEVLRVPQHVLRNTSTSANESSATVRARVITCRQLQTTRAGTCNARLTNPQLQRYCALNDASHKLLEQAMDKLGLSARAYHRIIKIARTIADLDTSDTIQNQHLSEAIAYRRLDRTLT